MPTSQMSDLVLQLHRAARPHDGAGPTDGALLGRFVERRDEEAFAALVRRHGPMVWGVCRRLLGRDDADDAFQATFLVLVRKANTINPREMVGNWLHGVARQAALHARRTVARRRARESQVREMPDTGAVPQDQWSDVQPLLDEELSRLPDSHRAVLVLCDLEGRTRKEAARHLGVPEGTVAGRLARARAALAKRLAGRGVTLSGGALAAVLSEHAAAGVPAAVVSSTIRAATLFAAGLAPVPGAIPAGVTALTEGVLKAMLVSKLKVATAVLLALACVGGALLAAVAQDDKPGPPKGRPAEAARDDGKGQDARAKADLAIQGVWTLVSRERDGKALTLPEGGSELYVTNQLWVSKERTRDRHFGYWSKGDESPGVLDLFVLPDNLFGPETGGAVIPCVYEIVGDTLTVCVREGRQGDEGTFGMASLTMAGGERPAKLSNRDGYALLTYKRSYALGRRGDGDGGRNKTGATGAAAVQTDRDRLQGRWKVVSVAMEGQVLGPAEVKRDDIDDVVFKGDRLLSTRADADNSLWHGEFKLDDRRDPKQITIYDEPNGKMTFHPDPKVKTKVAFRGIYALEGDTLKVCLNRDGTSVSRPEEFVTQKGSGLTVFTFERVPTKADPVDGGKLLGAWDVTGAGGQAVEARFEFLTDGKLRIATKKDGTEYTVEGSHALKGNKLSLAVEGDGDLPAGGTGKVTLTTTYTVQTLTDAKLVMKDDKADRVLEFKRGK